MNCRWNDLYSTSCLAWTAVIAKAHLTFHKEMIRSKAKGHQIQYQTHIQNRFNYYYSGMINNWFLWLLNIIADKLLNNQSYSNIEVDKHVLYNLSIYLFFLVIYWINLLYTDTDSVYTFIIEYMTHNLNLKYKFCICVTYSTVTEYIRFTLICYGHPLS